jgi:hypothetical protein
MSRQAPDPLATTWLASPARASAPPPCGAAPGDLLAGRFRLGTMLGWGGQAVVFHAQDEAPRGHAGPLAAKLIRTDLPAAARAEAATLLKWEASLLRRLRHPALPRLAQFQTSPGAGWMVRELVDGAPLTSLLRSGPLEPRRVRELAAQLCALLRYLHTRTPPVICGDLKPANLVLRPDGTVALIDLGAAHTRTRRPPRSVRPRYGTPGYAPPEQLGGRAIDERSDLFSLAATCYELLTGVDPALTPLVFDHDRLARAAPSLAAALRPALEPDPERRPPTAAALHASLARLPPPPPLILGPQTAVRSPTELAEAALRHPRALDATIASGACEGWLADHPDPQLGALLHRLRAERRASPRARPLDTLLMAMAIPDGSPLLQATPQRLSLGDVPLRQTRLWSAPRQLTLANRAGAPVRWELECPTQPGAEVRVLSAGRALKKIGGALAPGGEAQLEIVAAGKSGAVGGELTLRCGQFETKIRWEGTGKAGIPVGNRIVTRLADLDAAQPGVVYALEALAARGALSRWLRAQRDQALADRIDAALPAGPLAMRLAVGALLHQLAPERFPVLALADAPPKLKLVAGGQSYLTLTLHNHGVEPCVVRSGPGTAWARARIGTPVLAPGESCEVTVALAPPPELAAGDYAALVTLCAGELDLPLTIQVEVTAEQWWQRALRWLRG